MKRYATSARQDTENTKRHRSRIDSFAFLSADIISDIIALNVLPPAKEASIRYNACRNNQIEQNEQMAIKRINRNLMEIGGLWGDLAVPRRQREIHLGTRLFLSEMCVNWNREKRFPNSSWNLANADDFRSNKQKINEATNGAISSFQCERCTTLDVPLHELDLVQNLFGFFGIGDTLPQPFLEALPTRFGEIFFTRTKTPVEQFELDFLRRQLRSKFLTKLTVRWTEFPVESFLAELVNFVNKSTFQELALSCELPIELVTEFYNAWQARALHETTKQRLVGNRVNGLEDLEAFFPEWSDLASAELVLSETHSTTPDWELSCRVTGPTQYEWELTGNCLDNYDIVEISTEFNPEQ